MAGQIASGDGVYQDRGLSTQNTKVVLIDAVHQPQSAKIRSSTQCRSWVYSSKQLQLASSKMASHEDQWVQNTMARIVPNLLMLL